MRNEEKRRFCLFFFVYLHIVPGHNQFIHYLHIVLRHVNCRTRLQIIMNNGLKSALYWVSSFQQIYTDLLKGISNQMNAKRGFAILMLAEMD